MNSSDKPRDKAISHPSPPKEPEKGSLLKPKFSKNVNWKGMGIFKSRLSTRARYMIVWSIKYRMPVSGISYNVRDYLSTLFIFVFLSSIIYLYLSVHGIFFLFCQTAIVHAEVWWYQTSFSLPQSHNLTGYLSYRQYLVDGGKRKRYSCSWSELQVPIHPNLPMTPWSFSSSLFFSMGW